MSKLNLEISQKLALYQAEKSLSDLTSIELVRMAFWKGEKSYFIWKEFRRNCD